MIKNAIEFGLGYDLAGLQTGGAQAQAMVKRTVAGIGSSAGSAAGAFRMLAPYLTGAFAVGGVKSLINFGSEITDLSEAAGLSTDVFQQWTFALEQNGGRQEDLVKTMGALIGKTQDALGGNEKAIDSFRQMGVSMADLRQRTPQQVLLLFADALKRSGADGETTSAMMDLLGNKLTLKLLPALKGGSEGFLELGKSASIGSAEAISKIDAIGDAFDKRMREMKVKGMDAFVGIFDRGKGLINDVKTTFDQGAIKGIVNFFKPTVPDIAMPDPTKNPLADLSKPQVSDVDKALAIRNFTPPKGPWDAFKNFRTSTPSQRGLSTASMAGGLSSSIWSTGRSEVGAYSGLNSGAGGLADGARGLIRKGDRQRAETSAAAAAEKARVEKEKAATETAKNTGKLVDIMLDAWGS